MFYSGRGRLAVGVSLAHASLRVSKRCSQTVTRVVETGLFRHCQTIKLVRGALKWYTQGMREKGFGQE